MILDPESLAIGLLAGAVLVGAPLAVFAARAREAFRATSADALNANNQAFLDLAGQHFGRMQESARGDLDLRHQAIHSTVEPVAKTLEHLNLRLAEVEKTRAEASGELRQHFESLFRSHQSLQSETGRLVQALRTPMGRGAWGEMQLERLLEHAGMQAGVHYEKQVHLNTGDGSVRPDIVIKLTDNKQIVIDAKTPMDAYLTAMETTDDAERARYLTDHAEQVTRQLTALSAKEYWRHFSPTPEFVVMFIPSEGACASALQANPGLIDTGMRRHVVLATPMTLFALLRTIVYGWKQESLAKNAAAIAALGAELYDRVSNLGDSYRKMGEGLTKAVGSYNAGVGQLENRVLVTARKLRDEHEITAKSMLETPKAVEESLRFFSATEMLPNETEH